MFQGKIKPLSKYVSQQRLVNIYLLRTMTKTNMSITKTFVSIPNLPSTPLEDNLLELVSLFHHVTRRLRSIIKKIGTIKAIKSFLNVEFSKLCGVPLVKSQLKISFGSRSV